MWVVVMDGTQSSFIINEDVLWMFCCCYVLVVVCVWDFVYGSAFFVGGQTRAKSLLVISAVAPVNSY